MEELVKEIGALKRDIRERDEQKREIQEQADLAKARCERYEE